MGQEANCTLRWKGAAQRGRALLESEALLFRGPRRLRIPLKEITSVAASNGELRVRFPGGTAVFVLGSAAARWAERIRSPRSLIDKLGVAVGARVAVLGVDDPAFWAQILRRTEDIALARPRPGTDAIFLRARNARDLARLRPLQRRLQPKGAIWVVALKGTAAPLREAEVLAGGKAAGLVDVKVVSFSETLTAHKFVIPVERRPRG